MFIRISSRNRHFFIAVAVTLATLSIIVALGFLQAALSGPRIRFTQYIPAANPYAGGQLLLHANRPLDTDITAMNLTLTPKAAYTVSIQGNTIAIQLKTPLRYGSEYTLRVEKLTGAAAQSKETAYEHRFITEPGSFYILDRQHPPAGGAAKPDDRIVLHQANTPHSEEVYAAPAIRAFRVSKDYLIVAETNQDHLDTLYYQKLSGPTERRRLPLPGNTYITQFEASRSTNIIGLSVHTNKNFPGDNDTTYDATLLLFDIDNQTLTPVSGVDGEPTTSLELAFSPLDSSYLNQSRDNGVYLANARSAKAAVALGQFFGFSNFNPDRSKLLLTRSTSPVVLDAASREVTPVPSSIANANKIMFMNTSDRFLLTRNKLSENTLDINTHLMIADEDGNETELAQARIKTAFLNYPAASPNDQYASYETAPADTIFDNYGSFARPESVQTVLVEIESGREIKRVAGSGIIWR